MLSRSTILMTGLILLVALPTSRYWTKRGLGLSWSLEETHPHHWHYRYRSIGYEGLSSDPVLGYEVVGLLDEDPNRSGTCIAVCGDKKVFVLGHLETP